MRFKKFKFKKVKSTNNTAIRIIRSSNFRFGMVIAETQSNGKGQYGKKWISDKGNLFVSFFHELKNINISLPSITKINCLMVKKALQKYYKKKISGILQETTFASGNKFLIVGIGVNLIKSPEIKSYPTTNLSKLINKPINKINFENELKVIFEKNLSKMYKINNKVKRN